METLLILRVKNVFGIPLIYPQCRKSKAFTHLTGKKTLSPSDLYDIAFLGFRIGFNNLPSESIEPYNQNGFVGFQKFLDEWDG